MPARRTKTPPGERTQAGRVSARTAAERGPLLEDGPAVMWSEPRDWAASGIPILTAPIQALAATGGVLVIATGRLLRVDATSGTAHVRREGSSATIMLGPGTWKPRE